MCENPPCEHVGPFRYCPIKGCGWKEPLPSQTARDVLADRIETWADTEDWHVYDYADRLLKDLDDAGFQVVRRG